MFGPKFYPLLNKLGPWRQSLFALALAHRQFSNYALYTEVNHLNGKSEFKNALKTLWQFHTQKFNHINLETELEKFEPFSYTQEEDTSLGYLYAIDASISLISAFDAILSKLGDEAQMASKASMGAVVRTVEQGCDSELDDETLRQSLLVDTEVNFQVGLYELIAKAPRSNELCQKVIQYIYKDNVSNIGIEIENLQQEQKEFIAILSIKG